MSQAATVLREARRSAGISQAALARSAGTSQSAIARYEGGLMEPSVEALERLISACGQRLEVRALRRFPGPIGQILERRRADVLAACVRHGASAARVFGSVARGQDRGGSDVDLLVELAPGRTLLDLERLEIELAEILGVRVDLATPQILRGGVSDDARADLVSL